MTAIPLLWVLGLAQAAAGPATAVQRDTLLADDKAETASARLIEASDSVTFEITSRVSAFPLVAIDANRNGTIEPEADFSLSVRTSGAPCLQRLLGPRKSSACIAPGGKAHIQTNRHGELKVTRFTFPKKNVSLNGSGFGYLISIWNENGKYDSRLAAGDYTFGGGLKQSTSARTFLGSSMTVPGEIMPALGRYQECLRQALGRAVALGPSKLDQVRAVPTRCARDRKAASEAGTAALVAAGAQEEQASSTMENALARIDAQTSDFIRRVESEASTAANK